MISKLSISVVVPVYSGEKYLIELVEKFAELRKTLSVEERTDISIDECIFVCDEPVDDSLAVLERLRETNPWVKIIELSNNFGQHAATVSGILHTSGNWIVTMDEDLQHDPKFIPEMLELALKSSRDIVYGQPTSGVHGSAMRDGSSKMSKKFLALLTGNKFIKQFNSYRLIRGSVARAYASIATSSTYFDVGLCWYTKRIVSLPMNMEDSRYQDSKKSGYTFGKLMRHFKNLLVSSNTKLYGAFIMLGIVGIGMALLLFLYIIINTILYGDDFAIQGWPSLMITNLFFFGIITGVVGLTFEYITIILQNNQGQPTFYSVDRSQDKSHLETLKK